MSNPEDFTIAWICALSTEYAAARAFLDEELPDVQAIARNDNNEYTLGIMGRHRVVIASLPDGEYGLSADTGIARNMMSTFPNIRAGLLVEIGGGAPSPSHPIRLGDVVVSRPSGNYGGVFQYDFGKMVQTGDYKHTRFLNQPPPILRAAVGGLRARHESDGHQIQQGIQAALERKPKLRKKFSRPPAASDRLYCSTLLHPENVQGSCVELCGEGAGDFIERKERADDEDDPQIYYGLIASANSLVKDAILRDKLAKEKGVLCFEMLAAGLMNHFPCLVICGICDYSDTHKNKEWQGYAAMTAAAYAKELIGRVALENVQDTRRLTDLVKGVESINDGIQTISLIQGRQMDFHVDKGNRKLLQMLKVCAYESFKNKNPPRAGGTCGWVQHHSRYIKWRDNPKSDLIWISADPGCGKSVLARAFVDDSEFCFSETATKCYFFFKDNDEQNSLSTALCSLLHQILSQQPELLKFATAAWWKGGAGLCQDICELWRIFSNIALSSEAGPIVCILDALDECKDNDRSILLTLIRDLYTDLTDARTNGASVIKLLVTSRPYNDLEQQLSSIPEIRLRGEDENETLRIEIDSVIKSRVDQMDQSMKMSLETKSKLERTLLGMEHRTYLWLHLAFETIKQKFRNSWKLEAEDIDTLPSSVQDAYEKMLDKIVQFQDVKARLVLGIVAGARRPFTINELAYMLGIATTETVTELEDVVIRTDLRRWIRDNCYLFIYFNNDKAYLIHSTAKEFLLQNEMASRPQSLWSWSFRPREADEIIASICIKALCSNDFLPTIRKEIDDDKFRLLQYCIHFWTSHTTFAYDQVLNVHRKQIDLLHDPSEERCKTWFRIFRKEHGRYTIGWGIKNPKFAPEQTQASLCAYTGHSDWLKRNISAERAGMQEADKVKLDALNYAICGQRCDAVRVLLEKGVPLDAPVDGRCTPLCVASANGFTEIVEILLSHGADAVTHCGSEPHALNLAAQRGFSDIA